MEENRRNQHSQVSRTAAPVETAHHRCQQKTGRGSVEFKGDGQGNRTYQDCEKIAFQATEVFEHRVISWGSGLVCGLCDRACNENVPATDIGNPSRKLFLSKSRILLPQLNFILLLRTMHYIRL